MTFRAQLKSTFEKRCARNRRYSLRSFARSLATNHSTLSQYLSAKRRLTTRTIRTLGKRLGLRAGEIEEFCALENEVAILSVLRDPRFRADSRWLAVVLNIPVDEINIALQRLLRKRSMIMNSQRKWQRVGT